MLDSPINLKQILLTRSLSSWAHQARRGMTRRETSKMLFTMNVVDLTYLRTKANITLHFKYDIFHVKEDPLPGEISTRFV